MYFPKVNRRVSNNRSKQSRRYSLAKRKEKWKRVRRRKLCCPFGFFTKYWQNFFYVLFFSKIIFVFIKFQTLQIGQDPVPIHCFSVTPKFSWKKHLITLSNRAFNTRANRSTRLCFLSFFCLPHLYKSKRGLHVSRWGRTELCKHYDPSL